MANTSKLGLTLINGSDVVDYNVFNTNFNKLDVLGTDYVVQQGTSDRWWYRKWKSGRAECGIDNKQLGDIRTTEQWGGIWASQTFSFGAYPIAFQSRPYASITFNYAAYSGYAAQIIQLTQGGGTTSPGFKVLQPSNVTAGGGQFGIFVTGYWS